MTRGVGRAAAVAGDPLLRLMYPPWRDAPRAYLGRLLGGPPVIRSRVAGVGVARAALCTQVLRDRRFGVRTTADGPPGGRPGPDGRDPVFEPIDLSFLAADPPDHTRLRRLAQPAFAPARIRVYRDRARALAAELVDAVAGASGPGRTAGTTGTTGAAAPGEVELVGALATRLSGGIVAEILGLPVSEVDRLVRCGGVIGEALGGLRSLRQARAVDAAAGELRVLLAANLDRRRADPRDDLLSRLAAAVDDGEADRDEALAMAVLLVLAGFETTGSLISNAVAAMLDAPPAWEWLCARPAERAAAVVQETLRYDPPVRFTVRVPHVDVELAGATVPADTPVFVVLAAAGRDPAVHADPHVFDPARPSAREHLAFAGGVHFCPGAPLALLEAETMLAELAARLPGLRRAGPGRRWSSPLLGGYREFPVRVRG